LIGYQDNPKDVSLTFLFPRRETPFWGTNAENGEVLAKLSKTGEVVIPGKRSATRNPGFSKNSGFRLSPE
jgi:hypothetical protein